MPALLRPRSENQWVTCRACNGHPYHLVRSTHKDGDSTGVGTFFDDKHLIARRAKGEFAYDARFTQFFFCEFLESGHDAAMCSYGD